MSSDLSRQQIASLQKVISMQQKENSKLQENINLLESEVEEMKASLHRSQKLLNAATDNVSERDEKIKALEEKLKVALIERKAFEKFSSQNKMLLDRYLAEQKESERHSIELCQIREDAQNLRIAIEEKAKSLTEKEIDFDSQIRALQDNLKAERKEKTLLKDTLAMHETRIDQLQRALAANIEMRSEELARSRQTEYRTLLKADQTGQELQRAKDDIEVVSDALKLSTFQAGTLKGRLTQALDKAEQSESLLHTVVSKAEESNNMTRAQERRLRKENDILQNKVIAMTLSLRDASERNRMLEQRLKKALQGPLHRRGGGGLNKTHFREGMSSDSNIREIRLPHAGPVSVPNSSNKARTTGSIRVEMGRPQPEGSEPGDDDSCDSSSILCPPGFSSSLDASRSEVFPQSTVSDSDELQYVFDQSSSVLLSDTDPDAENSAVIPQDCLSAFDNVQYQGKRCLLAKHLRHIVTIHNTLAVPPSLKSEVMDLSRCAINDDDMIQVIDWWRLMSVKDITLIDLRSNMLTVKGTTLITAWILSLSSTDLLDRVHPLHINCQFNMVRSVQCV